MSDLPLYITRKSAQKFLDDFGKALNKPQSNSLVFHVHGIGGIGKSTLLKKLGETYEQEAKFARAFFGPTSRVDSPLTLMEHLYKQLPDDGWGEDAFTELCKKFKETLNQLETESVEGRDSVCPEQVGLVKKFLGGAVKAIASWRMPDKVAEHLGNVAEGVVDVASLALSEKDRLEQLLKQHRATKNKRELQELMLDPLPKLTQAFATGVIQKSQSQPIVLELDTYEKASSEFDTFLCKYLLGDTALQSYPVRIVMAGRYSLKNKRYQRMFQYHWQLINEYSLEKFDKKETREYLKEIGIDQPDEVRRVTKATKGLPYFLNLIKDQKEEGRIISFFRDSDEIVDRLLDGLNPIQQQVVQLASYCRWFDRPMIQYLVEATNLDAKSQAEEEAIDWFDWLIERDFVIREDHYRVDDVARDVIRAAQHRADEQNFHYVHDLLSRYFEQLADKEVPHDSPVPTKYENSDWREHTTEMIYHSLFANRDRGQSRILTHFFEGIHLKQPDITINAFTAVAAEAEIKNNELLPKDTRRFLDDIQFAVFFGGRVLDKKPSNYEFNIGKSESARNEHTKPIKLQIESALENCFRKTNTLSGLAKYAGLMGRALRCQPNQRLNLILQAKKEAEKIITLDYPKFSCHLFFKIGNAFESLQLSEEALASYDKAIELKPDDYEPWNNRGNALLELERNEEALASYAKAIELKSDDYRPWNNRGNVLNKLERNQEALVCCDKAIELKPDYYGSWHNRGNALTELDRNEEALASFDKAIELQSGIFGAWFSRGHILEKLERYEEALASYDKALHITKDNSEIWNLRGLCLSFLHRYEEAIDSLNQAIKLDKEEEPLFLANKGIVLARASRYDEALALCAQALDLRENEASFYSQACCYALQGNNELALEAFRQAINYAPRQCCREAKHNPDFNGLRHDERFQALLNKRSKSLAT